MEYLMEKTLYLRGFLRLKFSVLMKNAVKFSQVLLVLPTDASVIDYPQKIPKT